ncbi:MAG: hypothetical protein V2A77_02655 [Pseudomonadota bacterium]
MKLDTLFPELVGKDAALTPVGLFLVKLPKGCVAVFTKAEYLAAIGRGKGIIRSRAFHQRLQAAAEERELSENRTVAQAVGVGVGHEV